MQAALDSTALMLSKDAQTHVRRRSAGRRRPTTSRPCSPGPTRTTSRSPPAIQPTDGGQLLAQGRPAAAPSTRCSRAAGHSRRSTSRPPPRCCGAIKKLNLALVLDNTGSMASEQQDDGPQDRRAQSAHTLKNAAKNAGRHQGLDHPVRHRRQRRHQQRQRSPGSTGPMGGRQRHLQQHELHTPKQLRSHTARSGRRRTTTPGTAASTTATRTTTYHQHRAGRRQHLFRAHQDSRLPGVDDAAEQRLDRAERQDRRHDADRQHQRHHRACRWAGNRCRRSPFNAPAPDPTSNKVIILLTDGTNTQNRWYTQRVVDRRAQQKACDNIKAANIKLYTVRVTSTATTSTLLQNCATNSSKFFLLTDARARSSRPSARSAPRSPICGSRCEKRLPSSVTKRATCPESEAPRRGAAAAPTKR